MLDSMTLGDNIAKNAALRENVFMMAICVELRIPLFLVGKPGSSKSLAKAIINESMNGKYSKHELLKEFKEVIITWFRLYVLHCIYMYIPNLYSRFIFFHTSAVSFLPQIQ